MDFDTFRQRVLQTFRLDLTSYKENQLRRRLDNLLVRRKLGDYQQLFDQISRERQAYEEFLDYLTINVSEFFRDPQRWQDLEQNILPDLLRRFGQLKIWSAACSIGAEPYSVAILLEELSPGKKHVIQATDLDKSILQQAQQGIYHADAVRHVPPGRLSRYFQQQGNSYIIKEQIKNKVQYFRHDLLADKYDTGYHLILCRNVTIYFTRQAQDKINRQFSQSLVPGGVLFIGGSEMIFNYQELGLEKMTPCFYRKSARRG
ncbi:MAG: CheR family methyltransferase [Desulfurispora sp.]|uniref:CheR family methyltransferase n=1 Tax=Desulfurispora sp. TaxID=3014275 RepID=UPI00404A27AD